ncbi:MAG: DEAD/DEAH box helicase [Actinomycetota bacterium]|nr:DEAD/DEAH box helicase [Actinomycetota bacterium]
MDYFGRVSSLSSFAEGFLDLFSPTVIERGRNYFDEGRVGELRQPKKNEIEARVVGTEPYVVRIKFRQENGRLSSVTSLCSCPVKDLCKHIAATLIAVVEEDPSDEAEQEQGQKSTGDHWSAMLNDFSDEDQIFDTATPVAILFDLKQLNGKGTSEERPMRLCIKPIVGSLEGKKWISSGYNWDLSTNYRLRVAPEKLAWFTEVAGIYSATMDAPATRSYRYPTAPTWIALDDLASASIFALLKAARDLQIPMVTGRSRTTPVRILESPFTPTIEITEGDEKDLLLTPQLVRAGLDTDGYQMATLGVPATGVYGYRKEEEGEDLDIFIAPLAAPIPKRLIANFLTSQSIVIEKNERQRFFASYLPQLAKSINVIVSSDAIVPETLSPKLEIHVVREASSTIRVNFTVIYRLGDEIVRMPQKVDRKWSDPRFMRDLKQEASLVESAIDLTGLAPHQISRGTALISDDEAIIFLDETLKMLEENPDFLVIRDDNLPLFQEIDEALLVSIATSDSTTTDWLDLGINIEVKGRKIPIAAVLTLLTKGQSRYYFEDGSYVSLNTPEIEELKMILSEAETIVDSRGEGGLRVDKHQIDFLDELSTMGALDGRAESWRSARSRLADIESIPNFEVPETFTATLRPYQTTGFNWLAFLQENQMGGVLADDMGLGKTLQAIALLTHIYRDGKTGPHSRRPTLVVAPTSVAGNWANELERFAPNLRVHRIASTSKKSKVPLEKAIKEADIVISTYAIVRLDEDHFTNIDWEIVILDEAQFVKNHRAKSYSSARRLGAQSKFALTGTPFENNLTELWSVLSIVAPGLFGDEISFRTSFANPIEKGGDREVLARLQRRISPLMLRRTKSEVVTELPPKTESVLLLDLNERHRRAYDTIFQRERQRVLGLLDDFSKNRMAIFQSLTKLRQGAIDASLVDEAFRDVAPTKFDALIEQLNEIITEGHRTLIFSQFTTVLKRLAKRIEVEGLDYLYLDGATKDRDHLVRSFQLGTTPIFLISLKAGGVGLNLTAADYCYILDPWWNPAVENQAIDRIHRIGQSNPVVVYRMIAKDTIEEKVLQLSLKKARLFDDVLEGREFSSGIITVDDLKGLLE